MTKMQMLTTSNADMVWGVGPQELLFTADGNVKWYSRFERQFDGFLEN